MRKLILLFAFLSALFVGHRLTVSSWNGLVYVYTGEQRAPASTRTVRDYAAFDRRALVRDAYEQLATGAQLIRKNGHLGIILGHPLLAREGGDKDFACPVPGHRGTYDRLEIVFTGVGISEAGEPPLMTVETNCESGAQLDLLQTVWVPMDDIMSAQAKDQELQVAGAHPVWIRFQQIPDQWPDSWAVKSVRLYRESEPEQDLEVTAQQIRAVRLSPLTFQWAPSNQAQ